MKRCGVTLQECALSPEVLRAAEEFLPALLPAANSDGTPSTAFAVLHHGVDAIWFNVYAWCQEVILSCRAGRATLDGPPVFKPLDEPLIGCVWELPALVYERSAWVRHLLIPERPDLAAYLADLLPAGPVGGP